MNLYHITWEIDIQADSHRHAAETVRSWLLDPGAECVIFEVQEHQGDSELADPVWVDLMEESE